jgi:hypothetical protein
MTASAVPLATRFHLPSEAAGPAGGPLLEFHHHPMFSCAAYDAAAIPRQPIDLFRYLSGGTVAGAGTGAIPATGMHTNAVAIGTIPSPKTFTVTGIRVVIPPLDFTTVGALEDDTVDTTEQNDDQVDDLTFLHQLLTVLFKIGDKEYVNHPIWMLPANTGIGGLVATSVHANAAVSVQRRVAIHSAGVGYEFRTGRKPVLWPTNNFQVQLGCAWGTNPTLVDHHLVYVVLDGVQGREVQ